jgi:AcrR family transcriptional regulator
LETEGTHALTIARLAREVDVAVGGLYRYFDGKDALEAALQVRAIEAFAPVLLDHLDRARDPRAAVHAVHAAWRAFSDHSPALFALADQSLSNPERTLSDDAAREVELALQGLLLRCDQVLEDAVTAGLLAPGETRLRTLALWAAVHGVAHFRKRDRILPADQQSGRVAALLIDGLLKGWAG